MTDTVLKESPVREQTKAAGTWPELVGAATERHRRAFEVAGARFSNLSVARERAAFTRWKTIENLDKYLIEFEANFIKSGGKVIWAQDLTDAALEIIGILKKAGAKNVLRAKSQTLREIGLDVALEQENIRILGTDTGDHIVQRTGDESSHMILPALHLEEGEIINQFKKELQGIENPDASDVVKHVRSYFREEFLTTKVGITGANFLVADPGAVVIVENEGNAQLSAALSNVHIVVAGIEKILPCLADLDLFLPLLSTYGTGQAATSYTSIITGPRQTDELDGPEELYVILLDNGRSSVLAQEVQRQAMNCIHCGACQYACPVYHAAGAAAFPSPVAAVKLPLQHPEGTYNELAHSSTLCGACREVCPVKIDLPRLLLENRKWLVDHGQAPRSERWFYFLWKKAMLKRDIMNWKGLKAGRYIMNNLYGSKDNLRKAPTSAPKSFNEQWRDKMNYR